MIIVITSKERNEKTGKVETVVSHGVESETGRAVVLPCETPERIGARFDAELGEYILQEKEHSNEQVAFSSHA
jgi:hypothetical protein